MSGSYKSSQTSEKRRHPYMRKSWWKNPANFYWRRDIYKKEFAEKMDAFAERVAQMETGCYFKLIPDE